MIKDTKKTRGSSKLFKGANKTALLTYVENEETKVAVFRNEGCRDRAVEKMNELEATGVSILSFIA